MPKKKPKLQFRYYGMKPNEQVLALLGKEWIRPYGEDIDELHFHNYLEIGICYEGHGRSVLWEDVHPFEGGCILIVPPNYPHTNITDPGTVAAWEWMYFDMESVLENMNELSLNKLDTDSMLSEMYDLALFFRREQYDKLSRVILEIREECAEREFLYQEKIRGLLQIFAVELLRICNVRGEAPRKNPRSFQIAPALEYVKKHYKEEIKIQDLASQCNISESHFRRIFQECMNMTPNDHVNVVRIQEASKLLLKSYASMEEVAFQVGYGNVSTFNRNFKKLIGMTPYQWKRSPGNDARQMKDFKISVFKGW